MDFLRRWAWVVVLLFVAALATLFGMFPGGWFEQGADRDSTLLTATYAVVAVAHRGHHAECIPSRPIVGLGGTVDLAGVFVVHGVAFFPVDFVFAAVSALALLLTRPAQPSVGSAS